MSKEALEGIFAAVFIALLVGLPMVLLYVRDRIRLARRPRPEHIRSREYSFSFTRIPKDLLDQHTAESILTDSMGPYGRILSRLLIPSYWLSLPWILFDRYRIKRDAPAQKDVKIKFEEQGISIWESKLAEMFQSRTKSDTAKAICGFGDVELVKISENGEVLRSWYGIEVAEPSRRGLLISFEDADRIEDWKARRRRVSGDDPPKGQLVHD